MKKRIILTGKFMGLMLLLVFLTSCQEDDKSVMNILEGNWKIKAVSYGDKRSGHGDMTSEWEQTTLEINLMNTQNETFKVTMFHSANDTLWSETSTWQVTDTISRGIPPVKVGYEYLRTDSPSKLFSDWNRSELEMTIIEKSPNDISILRYVEDSPPPPLLVVCYRHWVFELEREKRGVK